MSDLLLASELSDLAIAGVEDRIDAYFAGELNELNGNEWLFAAELRPLECDMYGPFQYHNEEDMYDEEDWDEYLYADSFIGDSATAFTNKTIAFEVMEETQSYLRDCEYFDMDQEMYEEKELQAAFEGDWQAALPAVFASEFEATVAA